MRMVPVLPALALLVACGDAERPSGLGDPASGRAVIARLECGACHRIPGVVGARGTVGPSLDGFAGRAFIAGAVPNRPEILVRWVRDAPSLVTGTAMPSLPLSETEARDVAAYLYTLR